MSKFGWCFGPEGAIGDHDSCPYEIGADGAILRCGCACHESGESALGMGGLGVVAWDDSATSTDGPGGALTPLIRGLADCKESTDG